MTSSKRRRLLAGLGTALACSALPFPARALMGPNDKFDRVIKNESFIHQARDRAANLATQIRKPK